MATIVLAAGAKALVGGSGIFLPALAAGAGAAVGSYIDRSFVYPAIFGQDRVEQNRVENFSVQSGSEGSPINRVYGTTRVPGTVLWLGPPIERKKTTEEGGKGGGGAEVDTYSYFRSMAVAVCEGEIEEVEKIFGFGKQIADVDRTIDETSNLITAQAEVTTVTAPFGPDSEQLEMNLISTTGGTDLTQFPSGSTIAISGFANSGNNGSFKVKSTSGTPGGTTRLRVVNKNVLTEANGEDVRIQATISGQSKIRYKNITINKGNQTQTASSVIEADLGVGNVPAYRNTAYVVIEELALQDFGNIIPQLSFVVREKTNRTIAETITDIVTRSPQLLAADIDVTGVSGILDGYFTAGPQTSENALAQIMSAFNLLMQEPDDKIRFFSRLTPTIVDVDEADLAAHQEGSDAPRKATFVDSSGGDFPREVNVSYTEELLNYQAGPTQIAKRIDTPSPTVVNVKFDIVLTATKSLQIGFRILWTTWANRIVCQGQLPPSYINLLEGDRIQFNINNKSFDVLLNKVERAIGGLISFEGVVEDIDTLTSEEVAEDPVPPTDPGNYLAPYMTLISLDIPPLTDNETQKPGFYVATAASQFDSEWLGSQVFSSFDDVVFDVIKDTSVETVMGKTLTVLGDNSPHHFDRFNTVDVELNEGELSSVSEKDVLAGKNFAVIGGEIIGFANATLIAANTYRLDTLLRGRRDTFEFTDDHAIGNLFVLLTRQGLEYVELTLGDRLKSRFLKSVASGGTLTDTVPIVVNPELISNKTFAVKGVRGLRTTTNDLIIQWHRVTRAIVRILQQPAIPLLEPTQEYEIDVLDAPGGNVLNTFQVSGSTSFVYTGAQQTTDGFTPGDPVDLEIFQLSAILGRGRKREATI